MSHSKFHKIAKHEKAVSKSKAGATRARNDARWESFREDVYQIYWLNNKTLPEIQAVVKTKHGFAARYSSLSIQRPLPTMLTCNGDRKWKDKLTEWGYNKYISAEDMMVLIQKAEDRLTREGKATQFEKLGRPIEMRRIEKFKRKRADMRQRPLDLAAESEAAIPDHITYHTPKAIATIDTVRSDELQDGLDHETAKEPSSSKQSLRNMPTFDLENEGQTPISSGKPTLSGDKEPPAGKDSSERLSPARERFSGARERLSAASERLSAASENFSAARSAMTTFEIRRKLMQTHRNESRHSDMLWDYIAPQGNISLFEEKAQSIQRDKTDDAKYSEFHQFSEIMADEELPIKLGILDKTFVRLTSGKGVMNENSLIPHLYQFGRLVITFRHYVASATDFKDVHDQILHNFPILKILTSTSFKWDQDRHQWDLMVLVNSLSRSTALTTIPLMWRYTCLCGDSKDNDLLALYMSLIEATWRSECPKKANFIDQRVLQCHTVLDKALVIEKLAFGNCALLAGAFSRCLAHVLNHHSMAVN